MLFTFEFFVSSEVKEFILQLADGSFEFSWIELIVKFPQGNNVFSWDILTSKRSVNFLEWHTTVGF